MWQNSKGFTLVEIMIVVAIIGLLAAIAIPNLLRARINAADRAICKELRTFSSGNESYRAAQNPVTYSPDVNSLVTSVPPYLDTTWNTASRRGFDLTYTVAAPPAATYAMIAIPTVQGSTGTNTYCIDQTGVITGSINDGAGTVPTGAAGGCTGGTVLA